MVLSTSDNSADAPKVGNAQAQILLVEDDLLLAEMTRDMLELNGFAVVSANNGQQALDVLSRHPDIDLLLTDVKMPGMDGYELAVRAREIQSDIRIVYLTGLEGGTDGATASGRVLQKPVDPDVLVAAIRAELTDHV